MKFDKTIMNPPYDRSLHLRILDTVIRESSGTEIVNLSPIRWLQDPLAEYKKSSDLKIFYNVYEHIESLQEIKKEEANAIFGIDSTVDLGIYRLSQTGGWKRHVSPLVSKLISKVIDDSMMCHLSSAQNGKYSLKFRYGISTETHTPDDKKYYCVLDSYDSAIAITGKGHTLYFNAGGENEIKNAHAVYASHFMRAWNKIVCLGSTNYNFMPYLDFSHSWTDKQLYEHFSLTKEEISIIENEVLI